MKPLRTCVVCRQVHCKDELIRTVRLEGKIIIDKTHKKQGRGAYICKNADCLKNARRRRAFERSFSGTVDRSLYDMLENAANGGEITL